MEWIVLLICFVFIFLACVHYSILLLYQLGNCDKGKPLLALNLSWLSVESHAYLIHSSCVVNMAQQRTNLDPPDLLYIVVFPFSVAEPPMHNAHVVIVFSLWFARHTGTAQTLLRSTAPKRTYCKMADHIESRSIFFLSEKPETIKSTGIRFIGQQSGVR